MLLGVGPYNLQKTVLAVFTHILFEGHFTKARYLKDGCMESNFLMVWKANNSFIVWWFAIDDDFFFFFLKFGGLFNERHMQQVKACKVPSSQ